MVQFGEGGTDGTFSGVFDSSEELAGSGSKFEFPVQSIVYTGGFEGGTYHGKGQIDHTDTGNVY